ncbi:YicC/YloC family endoribonuclease [Peptoniphilaceae bacterium SGI.131]
MIKSMTGFGKSHYMDENLDLDLEIKSVNSRYLDISIKMPNQLNFLEDKLKKTIKSFIERGRVDLFIRSQRKGIGKSNIIVDLDLAKEMKTKLDSLCKAADISSPISLRDILINDDILVFQSGDYDESYLEKALIDTVSIALEKLDIMRIEEGRELYKDLDENITRLENLSDKIGKYAENISKDARDRLYININKLIDKNIALDEERLANEVAYFADKADINEELIRLKSHFVQFRQSMAFNNAIGKKLDFITQEMLRETNTIGSKSSKLEITELVIEMKTIIEKIKEQVQNIE